VATSTVTDSDTFQGLIGRSAGWLSDILTLRCLHQTRGGSTGRAQGADKAVHPASAVPGPPCHDGPTRVR